MVGTSNLKMAAIVAGVLGFLYLSRNAIAKGYDIVIAAWMEQKTAANLSKVTRDLLDDTNVQAMLRVIRAGESSASSPAAYQMIVGGGTFSSFADHPRVFGVPNSTAAGAYQITKTTWDWIKVPLKLSDFSPANQDFAALGLIAYRGALADVLRGDLAKAVPKLRDEWTSLPGASENYGITLADAAATFAKYGGGSSA